MLSFDQLNVLPDSVTILFEKYQSSVIKDIARRLAKLPYLSPTAAWQMARLIESGAVYENALDLLVQTNTKSKIELRRLFKKAGIDTLKFDDAIYIKAGFKPTPLQFSPAMMEVLSAGYRKTAGLMENLLIRLNENSYS